MHVEVTIIYLNNIAPIFYYDIKSHGVQLILIGLLYEKHSNITSMMFLSYGDFFFFFWFCFVFVFFLKRNTCMTPSYKH